MISTVLLVVAIGAAVGGGVRLFKTHESEAAKGREWVEESVDAWRSKELDRKQFEVRHEDLELDDLFSTFDHDDRDPYYSPEDIEERLTQVTGSSVPKRFVDSTELAALRAMEAAKKARAKRAAEATEKADGSPSTTDMATANVLAAKDLLVQGTKVAGRGLKNAGRGAVGAGKSVTEAVRARRAGQPKKKAAPVTNGTPVSKRPPAKTPDFEKDVLPPQAKPQPKKWPSTAPKLAKGDGSDQRESA